VKIYSFAASRPSLRLPMKCLGPLSGSMSLICEFQDDLNAAPGGKVSERMSIVLARSPLRMLTVGAGISVRRWRHFFVGSTIL